MATLKILAWELSKAFVLYRQPMPEREEFEVLVRTWEEVLGDIPDAEFREGLRCVQRESRFFPVPADVMRQVEAMRRQTPQAAPLEALPGSAMTFDERCALGAEKGREILAMLGQKLGAASAVRHAGSRSEQCEALRAWEMTQ